MAAEVTNPPRLKTEDFDFELPREAIAARPAVAKDMARLEDTADRRNWTDEQWSILFGAEQTRRR